MAAGLGLGAGFVSNGSVAGGLRVVALLLVATSMATAFFAALVSLPRPRLTYLIAIASFTAGFAVGLTLLGDGGLSGGSDDGISGEFSSLSSKEREAIQADLLPCLEIIDDALRTGTTLESSNSTAPDPALPDRSSASQTTESSNPPESTSTTEAPRTDGSPPPSTGLVQACVQDLKEQLVDRGMVVAASELAEVPGESNEALAETLRTLAAAIDEADRNAADRSDDLFGPALSDFIAGLMVAGVLALVSFAIKRFRNRSSRSDDSGIRSESKELGLNAPAPDANAAALASPSRTTKDDSAAVGGRSSGAFRYHHDLHGGIGIASARYRTRDGRYEVQVEIGGRWVATADPALLAAVAADEWGKADPEGFRKYLISCCRSPSEVSGVESLTATQLDAARSWISGRRHFTVMGLLRHGTSRRKPK